LISTQRNGLDLDFLQTALGGSNLSFQLIRFRALTRGRWPQLYLDFAQTRLRHRFDGIDWGCIFFCEAADLAGNLNACPAAFAATAAASLKPCRACVSVRPGTASFPARR
jgi:hypothetical protein